MSKDFVIRCLIKQTPIGINIIMKKIILCILIMFCFISPSISQETDNNDQIKLLYQRIVETSLKVVAIYGQGVESGFCSGVILENTDKGAVVLTAKHCLGVVNEIYADNSEIIDAKLSFKYDLALVYTNKKIENKSAIVVSKQDEEYQKIVYLIGYPKLVQFISAGYTLVRTHNNQFAKLDIQHGCSGGGVFNENGELIGIATMGVFNDDKKDVASLTIFEPIKNVRDFLSTINYKVDN